MKQEDIPGIPITPAAVLKVLQSLPVGVLVADEGGTIRWVNDMLCQKLVVPAGQLIGESWAALSTKHKLSLPGGPGDPGPVSPVPKRADRWFECVSQRVSDIDGQAFELICLIDAADHVQLRKPIRYPIELGDPSKRDELTGVWTQNAVMKELASQVSRSRRYENPLSVLLMRIQYAPAGTDPHQGVELRDAVVAVADILKDKLRWVDVVGRWEEDGFLLVLPETPVASATKLAEKVCANITDLRVSGHQSVDTEVATSFAVTEWRQGDDAWRMVKRVVAILRDPLAGDDIKRIDIA